MASAKVSDRQLIFLDPSTVQMSQIEDMARLCQKCFVGFNRSCNAHPEVLREDFGDPDMAQVLPLATSIAKGNEGYGVFDASGEMVAVAYVDVIAKESGVASIGPVSSCQPGEGRRVFRAVCDHAEEIGVKTLLLQQVSNNSRSFSLYSTCGFEAKHACHYVGGFLSDGDATQAEGVTITEMSDADVDECAKLFSEAYGKESRWNRGPSISAAVKLRAPYPMLVARDPDGKLVGYSTGFYIMGHQIATSEAIFRALFVESSRLHQEKGLPCPRFHCPLEYPGIMAWSLSVRLPVLRVTILMAKGPYGHAWPGNGYVALPDINGW